MPRIDGVDPTADDLERRMSAVFEAHERKWGAPLASHLIYARRPSIFHAARGMWGGLDASGLLDPAFVGLVNRRVAMINGCEF